MGWGCFGTPETSSTSTTTSTNKIPVPTYQPDTTAERAYSGITTLVETISLKFLSSSALSLQFPETITLPSNLAGWSIATTYVFSFPSTIFNTSSTSTTTSSTQSTSSATSSKSSSITTTSSKSSTLTPLCFNPNIQSPIPCSSSSPSSSHPSTSAYPAATTLHSSSPPTLNGPNIYYILSSLALMMAFVHVEFPKKLVVIALWAVNGAWRAWMVLTEEGEGRDSGSGKDGEGEGGNKEGDGDKAGKEEEGSIFKQVGEMTWYITVMPVVMGWEHLRQVIREPVS
ncbi:MAG: hypothetical protein LQ343_001125 [Gyalolechia ehrenbergii]|nr:MAG: hypothetical protein LQ343_001125 [Gyalolechia ehrenbergii]